MLFPPFVLRRLLVVLACLVAFAAGSAWWLTRRPLSWAERTGGHPTFVPLLRPAPPPIPVAVPAPAPAAPVPAPAEEAPIALPSGVAVPVRTQRGPTPRFHRTSNVLLVGVDATRSRALGRADTLIVAVFDDETGHVGFVSIPRDLYVDIPGYGPSRINATLRIGQKIHKDPLVLLRSVTSTALGIPIQDVAIADLGAFERAIDRLGGLTVDVPCAIEDNFIDARTPTGRRLLNVQVGRQHLDGVTAAMYARSRHGRSDWDRARRQQSILAALRDRAGQVGIDVWLPAGLDAIDQGVTTTMTRLEMLALARRAASIQRDHMHGVVVGTHQTQIHWTAERQAVLVPDYDAIDSLLATLFRAPSPGTRPAGKQCPDADVAVQ